MDPQEGQLTQIWGILESTLQEVTSLLKPEGPELFQEMAGERRHQAEGPAGAKAWRKQPNLAWPRDVRWVRWEGTLEPCESHVAFETEQALSLIGQPDLGVAGVEVEVGLKVERAPKYSSNHSTNI